MFNFKSASYEQKAFSDIYRPYEWDILTRLASISDSIALAMDDDRSKRFH